MSPLAARSENDLSFGFILRVGSFRYYTGGDLSGEDSQCDTTSATTSTRDTSSTRITRHGKSAMESPLVLSPQ